MNIPDATAVPGVPECSAPNKENEVETGEYVSTEVGRCDRENSCGYHKTPRDFFQETGGITDLRPETCAPLKGRNVILFPDLGAEDNWAEKAREIPGLNNSVISHWLSNNATDEMRRKGLGIADILEKLNPEMKVSITDSI